MTDVLVFVTLTVFLTSWVISTLSLIGYSIASPEAYSGGFNGSVMHRIRVLPNLLRDGNCVLRDRVCRLALVRTSGCCRRRCARRIHHDGESRGRVAVGNAALIPVGIQ